MLLSNLREKISTRKFLSLLIPDLLGVYAPFAILKAQHLLILSDISFNNLLQQEGKREKVRLVNKFGTPYSSKYIQVIVLPVSSYRTK